MKRSEIVKLLILSVLVGCTRSANDGKIVINLDKSSPSGINLTEYCEKIEILSLDEAPGSLSKAKYCVFDKGFIIQKDSTCLSYYDIQGHLQRELRFDHIEDFSTYRNKVLYILGSDKIELYDLTTMSHKSELPLPDQSFTYCKMAARDDNFIIVFAIRDGMEFSGQYDIKDRKCYLAEGTVKGSNRSLKELLSNSDFYYSEEDLYFFYANTGAIYRMADFFFLSYVWDFKYKEPLQVRVGGVQKMSDKLYMRIQTDKGDYCLITELQNYRPVASRLYSNAKTPFFPVGYFYNNTNYYLCDAQDVGRYISMDLLDSRGRETVDSLRATSQNKSVIIKYHLK